MAVQYSLRTGNGRKRFAELPVGVTIKCVTQILRNALAKMGISGRPELVRIYGAILAGKDKAAVEAA